jgi:hypothetical protein
VETQPSVLENTWRANAFGAFLAAKEAITTMLKAGRAVISFTGAAA